MSREACHQTSVSKGNLAQNGRHVHGTRTTTFRAIKTLHGTKTDDFRAMQNFHGTKTISFRAMQSFTGR